MGKVQPQLLWSQVVVTELERRCTFYLAVKHSAHSSTLLILLSKTALARALQMVTCKLSKHAVRCPLKVTEAHQQP